MSDLLVFTFSGRNMDFHMPDCRILLDKVQVALRSNLPRSVLVITGTEPSDIADLVLFPGFCKVHFNLAAPRVPCLDEVQISAANREMSVWRLVAAEYGLGVAVNVGKAILVACHIHLDERGSSVLRFDRVEVAIVDGENSVAGFTSTEAAWCFNIEGGIFGFAGQAMNLNCV